MRTRHAFAPTVPDRLEDRVVLSHGMLAPSLIGAAPTTPPQKHAIDLHGTVKGFATPSPLASAIPGALLLRGTGKVAPLGAVSLIGTFSIRSGEPTFYEGTVSLSNLSGGLQVRISGIVGGPSGPPAHLHYKIVGGWGAYRGAFGTGDVVYDQGHSPVDHRTPFSLTFGGPTRATT